MAEYQASDTEFETTQPGPDYVVAPDGAEVRPLAWLQAASIAHTTLPPGTTSQAVVHRTITEVWYFISGTGQVWRRQGDRQEVVDVAPGHCLTIPVGTTFQYRTTSDEPLCFLMTTMPPWPGDHEAIKVDGLWPV